MLDNKLNMQSNSPKLIIPEMIMDYGNRYGSAVRGYNHLMSKEGLQKTKKYFDELYNSSFINDPNNAQKFWNFIASGIGDIADVTFLHGAAKQLPKDIGKIKVSDNFYNTAYNFANKLNTKINKLQQNYRNYKDIKAGYDPYIELPDINTTKLQLQSTQKPLQLLEYKPNRIVNEDLSIDNNAYNKILLAAGFSPKRTYVKHPTYGRKVNTDEHMIDVYNTSTSMPAPLGYTNQQLSTAALLHDIGEIIGGRNNHGQVGSDFLRSNFNLDNEVVNAVENHMAAEKGLLQNQSELTKALHLADVGRGRSFRQQIHDYPLMGYQTQNSTKIQVPNNLSFDEQLRRINFILKTIGEPVINPKNTEQLSQQIQKSVKKLNSYIRGYKRDIDYIKQHKADIIKNMESDLGRPLTQEEIKHINAVVPGNGMHQWYKPEFLDRIGAFSKDGFTTNDVLYASQNAQYSRKNYGDLSIITAPIDYQHIHNPLQFLMDNLHNIHQNSNTMAHKYNTSILPHPLPSVYEYGIPEMAVNGTSTWKTMKSNESIDFSQETPLSEIQKPSPRFSFKKIDPSEQERSIGPVYDKIMNNDIQKMIQQLKDAGINVVTNNNTIKYPTILYQMQKSLDAANNAINSIENHIGDNGILQSSSYPIIQQLLSNISWFYASKRPYIEFNKLLKGSEKLNILFKYLRRSSDKQSTASMGIHKKRNSQHPLIDMINDSRLSPEVKQIAHKLNNDPQFYEEFMRQASDELIQILKHIQNISKEQLKTAYTYNMRNVFKKEKSLQSDLATIDPDVFYRRTNVEPMSVANMSDPNKMMFVSRGEKKNVGILTDYKHAAKGFTYKDVSNMSDKDIEKNVMSRIMELLTLFTIGGAVHEKEK